MRQKVTSLNIHYSIVKMSVLNEYNELFDLSKLKKDYPSFYGIFDSNQNDGSFLIHYFIYNSLINCIFIIIYIVRSTFLLHTRRDIHWYSNSCKKLVFSIYFYFLGV